MRPSLLALALALVLAAALLHPSAAGARTPTSPVSKFSLPTNPSALRAFCSHTAYYDLCVKSIRETAPRLRTLSHTAVLATLMRAVEAKAREGKAFALALAKQPAARAKSLELLRDCVDAYDTALGNLAAAGQAIRAGDVGARDSMFSSMIPNFGSCDDGFAELDLKSPMSAWNRLLKNMVDNCLAIANMGRA